MPLSLTPIGEGQGQVSIKINSELTHNLFHCNDHALKSGFQGSGKFNPQDQITKGDAGRENT